MRDLNVYLQESGALRQGHFLLSSGLHSPGYVQCALLLERPSRARQVGAALAERLRQYRPDSVLAPALGGLIIGYEVAAALDVPFRFCEREGAAMAIRRGFALRKGERVVVVEDVVTTGKSTREAAAAAGGQDAAIVALGAILDRSGGSHGFPAPFVSLMELDFPVYEPSKCPLCAKGGVAEKPGSRPAVHERLS